jgi:hypothetical protein
MSGCGDVAARKLFRQEHSSFYFGFIECCQLQAVLTNSPVSSASLIPSTRYAERSTS